MNSWVVICGDVGERVKEDDDGCAYIKIFNTASDAYDFASKMTKETGISQRVVKLVEVGYFQAKQKKK